MNRATRTVQHHRRLEVIAKATVNAQCHDAEITATGADSEFNDQIKWKDAEEVRLVGAARSAGRAGENAIFR